MPDSGAKRGSIAVLDDEPNMVKILSRVLSVEGYHVTTFNDPRAALDWLREKPVDVLLSDIRMPDMTGQEVLEKVRAEGHACEVIMMTAYATIEGAIACVKGGAFDYITKPFKTDDLLLTISRAMETKRLKDMNSALSRAWNETEQRVAGAGKDLIGKSAAMDQVRNLIARVAPSQSPVLVTGESGTGKELVARAIHNQSTRSEGRFVAINCASIPESLIESELFGHERGAFTGAHDTKIGLIELADGGTLFLDEIGELPLAMQAKLLRVLQEREITRVGGLSTIRVNIRLVSATNRDLAKEIEEKRFREDLFYRLNVIAIDLPALRERREDIPELAEFLLRRKCEKHQRGPMQFAPETLSRLRKMDWPGNVRQLENAVERMVVLAESETIGPESLPAESGSGTRGTASYATPLPVAAEMMVAETADFKSARESFEKSYIEALLRQTKVNVTEAAKAAGMSRRNLYEKIERLDIDLDRLKAEAAEK